VGLRHLLGRRDDPRADRPDRLVGDQERRPGGRSLQRPRELSREDILRLAALALRQGLADAEDRRQPGPPRRPQLGARDRIVLAEEPPPLRVAHQDVLRAGVVHLLGRDFPGEGAPRLRVAVLRPERRLIRPARPARFPAASESPPPTTVKAPRLVAFATSTATPIVPSAYRATSKTPIGPFQNMVRASESASAIEASDSGPMSTPAR